MRIFKKIIKDLEAPIIYLLTVLSAAVGLLVYGHTKLRSSGGLFDFLKPVFGIEFTLVIGAAMLLVIVINRRWKAIFIVVVGQLLFTALAFSPFGRQGTSLDDFLIGNVTIAGLLLSTCLYYDVCDQRAT